MEVKVEINFPFKKQKDSFAKYANKYNYLLKIGFITILISAILQAILLLFTQKFSLETISNKTQIDIKNLFIPFIMIVCILILKIVNAILKNNYIKKSTEYIKKEFIKHLFNNEINVGENGMTKYLTSINVELDTIETNYFPSKFNDINNSINMLVGMIVVGYINIFTLIFAVVFIILALNIVQNLMSLIEKKFENFEIAYTNTLNKVNELINSFWLIKANAIEDKAIEQYKSDTIIFEKNNRLFNFYTNLIIIIIQIVLYIALFIGLVYLGFGLNNKSIEIADILIIFACFIMLLGPSFSALNNQNSKQIGNIAFNKINEIFQQQTKVLTDLNTFDDKIEINNVSVKYDNKEITYEKIIIKKNQKVLITGTSGCGKSTLLKIITNLKRDYNGEAKIDNILIKDINPKSYYRLIAYLSQDVYLFNDTILNNIIMKQPLNKDKLDKVIKLCCVDKIVSKKEGGLNYRLENCGNNLSGGEKARIALARALYFDKKIIILDEPFANLDIKTYSVIEQNLLSLNDITLICVSHVSLNNDHYDQIIKL